MKHNTFLKDIDILSTTTRKKRALLPIANALKFLFGVGTKADVDLVHKQVITLQNTQAKIVHAMEKSLSLYNVTRQEVKNNREAINDLIEASTKIEHQISESTADVLNILLPLKNFILSYIRIENCIVDSEFLLLKYIEEIDYLYSKITLMTHNRLVPELIKPEVLKDSLTEISERIPNGLSFPVNPDKDIWFYYQYQVCHSYYESHRLYAHCIFPLVKSQVGLIVKFNAIPLPMEMGLNNSASLLKISHDLLVMNNTFGVVPDNLCEAIHKGEGELCIIDSVILHNIDSMEESQIPCEAALYFGKSEIAEKNCKIYISKFDSFPQIKKIGVRKWAIVARKHIVINISCTGKDSYNIDLHPPVSVLILPPDCEAITDNFHIVKTMTFTTVKHIYEEDAFIANSIADRKCWSKK